jgi:cob(I)alamin adenosyltransferase
MMKIYTKGGDQGKTGLFGGDRVSKSDPRVEAYGAIDELNAVLGTVLAMEPSPLDAGAPSDRSRLQEVQADLFVLGSRLAAARPQRATEKGSIPELPPDRITGLEGWIDVLEAELPPLDAFILPGGHPVGADLHVARTVCRRAERQIVALLAERSDLADVILPYVNRLSDLLFVLARAANQRAGSTEQRWLPVRERGTQGGDS